MKIGLLQDRVSIDGKAQWQSLLVVPCYPVLFDDCFRSSSAMFRRRGGGDMPFYVGGAGDERDVIEVDNLEARYE